jgi:hypothetical protein
VNAALALIEAAAPRDEIEAALAVQMACTHSAAIMSGKRMLRSNGWASLEEDEADQRVTSASYQVWRVILPRHPLKTEEEAILREARRSVPAYGSPPDLPARQGAALVSSFSQCATGRSLIGWD